ncbi:MAG: hypothetical protein IH822_10310 [Chloroflexi bacterium]|nr:hypothetical protein [Chloroflexota bacterium]
MDVAALIIAIVALVLALIVSGFGIVLQWLMFRANTEQVAQMGAQNAGLGERLTNALTEIREITTQTRGTMDTTMKDVVAAALPTVFGKNKAEVAPGELDTDAPTEKVAVRSWQLKKLIRLVKSSSISRLILDRLQSKPAGISTDDLIDAIPVKDEDDQTEDQKQVYRALVTMRSLTMLEGLDVVTLVDGRALLNDHIDLKSILAEAGGE